MDAAIQEIKEQIALREKEIAETIKDLGPVDSKEYTVRPRHEIKGLNVALGIIQKHLRPEHPKRP